MTKPNNAIILLAGFGSRLKPLTDTTHKALINIGPQSILERQINQLLKNNIQNIHLVIGHFAEQIKNFIHNNFVNQAQFYFYENKIYNQTNNAYSLLLALDNISDSFLLLDGDVIVDDQLLATVCHEPHDSLLITDTDKTKLDEEAMKLSTNQFNEILQISKKIPLESAIGESIGIGLYQKDWSLVLKSFLTDLMKDKANWNDYYEDILQKLITLKKAPSPLKITKTNNLPWVEVDDHQDLKRALEIF